MHPRLAFALLFGFAAIGFGLAIPAPPVDERCGDANAEYKECGPACEPTCNRPHPPQCSLRCMRGCFCKEGFLKNEKGVCVRAQECDGKSHPRIPLQIPSASFPKCPEKEELLACGSSCAPTCANPNPSPLCTKQCVVGCFCEEGHLRNAQGVCVAKDQCEAPVSPQLVAMQPRVCENENEEFRQCRGCDGTCDNPNPICPRICVPGCACKLGHLRDKTSGKCVPKETCTPKASPKSFMMPPPVQQCGNFEEFLACGNACPPNCARPNPRHCSLRCIPGCYCLEGYLRDFNGNCVPEDQCPQTTPPTVAVKETKTCTSDREMFVQDCGSQLDCMATCGMPLPWMIHGHVRIPDQCLERKCAASCVCIQPYVRNQNGQCVERAECDTKTTMAAH